MNKSTVMFSLTADGDLFFTGMITASDMEDMHVHEYQLLIDREAPLHKRLTAIANHLEEKAK